MRCETLSQGMLPTTTSGSDSAANGVAESGARYLKRRARTRNMVE